MPRSHPHPAQKQGPNAGSSRVAVPRHTHARLTALFPGLPRGAGTRKVKPIWIILKQETVSGSGISWAMCKSAPRSRQITMPTPHHSVFLQAGCPSCRPTNSVKALKAIAVPRQWVTLSIAKTEVADFSVRLLHPPEVLDLIAYIAYLSLWWSRLHYLEAGKRHVWLHCYFTFTLYRFPKRYNTRSYFTCAQKLTRSRTVNFIFHCKNMKSGS